jgi:hypothetical protein
MTGPKDGQCFVGVVRHITDIIKNDMLEDLKCYKLS